MQSFKALVLASVALAFAAPTAIAYDVTYPPPCQLPAILNIPANVTVTFPAPKPGCGLLDMLDWMTMDAQLRQTGHLTDGSAYHQTNVVEADRFWYLKGLFEPDNRTWDINRYDDTFITGWITEYGWSVGDLGGTAYPPADQSHSYRQIGTALSGVPITLRQALSGQPCAPPYTWCDRPVQTGCTVVPPSCEPGTRIVTTDIPAQTFLDCAGQAPTNNPYIVEEVYGPMPRDLGARGIRDVVTLRYFYYCSSGGELTSFNCREYEDFWYEREYGWVGWTHVTRTNSDYFGAWEKPPNEIVPMSTFVAGAMGLCNGNYGTGEAFPCNSGCPPPGPVYGYVDSIDCTSVVGWAFDPSHREAAVNVTLYKDGVPSGTYAANTARADLLAAGIAKGNHGFVIPVGVPAASYDVRLAATGESLIGSPRGSSCALSCTSFTVSPSSASPTSAAGSQAVTITGAPAGCTGGSWSTAGNGSWLSVSPSSGAGSGAATVSWASNASSARSAAATIAGKTFTVNQAAVLCGSFSISPTSSIASALAGSRVVTISGSPSGCAGGTWATSGNGSWLTVSPGSGAGPSTGTVSWAANTAADRTGIATIAGNVFTLNQDGLAPIPTSIVPTSGPMAGGTVVTITGLYFRAGATVSIGGAPATVTSVSPTAITATTGANACGTYSVVVTEGRENGSLPSAFFYTYPRPPAGLSPNGGSLAPATSVTLSWGGVSGATMYAVRMQDNSGDLTPHYGGNNCGSGIAVCVNGWGSTSFTATVVPGHTYTWWVHAGSACGQYGDPTYAAAFTVQVIPLHAPTGLRKEASPSMNLVWTPPDNATPADSMTYELTLTGGSGSCSSGCLIHPGAPSWYTMGPSVGTGSFTWTLRAVSVSRPFATAVTGPTFTLP